MAGACIFRSDDISHSDAIEIGKSIEELLAGWLQQ
jgi:hypothetical protein